MMRVWALLSIATNSHTLNLEIKKNLLTITFPFIGWLFFCPSPRHQCCKMPTHLWTTCVCAFPQNFFYIFGRKAIYCNSCWKAIRNFRFEASPLGISHSFFFIFAFAAYRLLAEKKITRNEHLMTHSSNNSTVHLIPFSFRMTQTHIKSVRVFVKIKLNKNDPHGDLCKRFWFVGQSIQHISECAALSLALSFFLGLHLSFQYCYCLHWY